MAAEIKGVKSWGNGYFRFSVRDIVAIITAASLLYGHYLAIKHDTENNHKDIIRVEGKMDSKFRAQDSTLALLVTEKDMRRFVAEGNEIHKQLWAAIQAPSRWYEMR